MHINSTFTYFTYNKTGVKMKEYITLDTINLNEKYYICDILLDKHIKKRLYDFGIIEQAEIEALYKSPFNDPVAYLIKGTIVAIRNDDAKNIIVRRI